MNYDNKKECALCNYWRIYMTGIHKCLLEDGNCPYDKNKEGGEAMSILSDMVGDNDNKQTNADRIRNMSDEELADWLHNMCDFEKDEEPYKSIYNLDTEQEEEIHDSYGDFLDWLQSEVKAEESEEK